MAVTHVGTQPKRSGSASARKNNLLFETLGRRYIRRIIVVTDDLRDGPQQILASAEMASAGCSVGSVYSLFNDDDSVATCVNVDVEETDNPFVWFGTVEYDTDRVVSALTDSPLNQPAVIRVVSASYERPFDKDWQGIPVVNSSNEKFDPPFTLEEKRSVITITRNEASFDDSLITAYEDTVNLSAYGEAEPGYAKLNSIHGEKQISNGIEFWSVTYEIEKSPLFGYWLFALDQGFRDIDGKLFRDLRDYTPLSNPTLLNGRGGRLYDAFVAVDPLTDADTEITLEDSTKAILFPPGPSNGTAHYYFDVQLTGAAGEREVCTVTGGYSTGTFTVVRGRHGTTALDWPSGANMELLPYYLRFMKYRFAEWSALSLPTL